MTVKLANESALATYRYSWTGGDGARMEVQWGEGLANPLAFRHGFPAEVRNPERFGFKRPATKKGFRDFAQRFADEFEAGEDDD
jgi:hypothetical protein